MPWDGCYQNQFTHLSIFLMTEMQPWMAMLFPARTSIMNSLLHLVWLELHGRDSLLKDHCNQGNASGFLPGRYCPNKLTQWSCRNTCKLADNPSTFRHI